MNRTITDQMDHTEKPTCSAKMDQIRLRLAIRLPVLSHASTSSASQCSIVRLRLKVFTNTRFARSHSTSIARSCPKRQHPLTWPRWPGARWTKREGNNGDLAHVDGHVSFRRA